MNTHSTSASRLGFVDNLKVALTVLVIAHHAGQSYGSTGGDWPVHDPHQWGLLGPFFGVNAAFFMGLFFFLSGLFVPRTLERKGPGRFVRDRLVRLGVPIVLWVTGYSLAVGRPTFELAHLWFVEHLLVYGVIAAVWWAWSRPPAVEAHPFPRMWQIFGYAAVLAAATFLVRIWWPIDRWTYALGFFRTEVAHLPQYVSMFVLGMMAGRRRWLESLSDRTVLLWAMPAVLLSVAYVLYRTTEFAFVPGLIATGGCNWAAALWALIEAVLCIGLSLGLIGLFRRLRSGTGWLRTEVTAGTYAAYVVHVLSLVFLQRLLLPLDWSGASKFFVVVAAGTILSFFDASILRRLPLLRSVF